MKQRTLSTSTGSATVHTAPSPASILGAFTNECDKIAPKFEVHGSQIQILRTPSEFYETLKISTLQQALRANPNLKLSILTDALRGTRESPSASCASLLAPLVSEFGADRVEIRMYHTPNLTGLRKRYIPKRINEGWGLQHMKLYGVDDEIIISGANLSSDYFTNRQDRYHVFSSKEVTQYFYNIQNAISSLSFLVSPDPQLPAGYTLEWPSSNSCPSPLTDSQNYISHASSILTPLIQASTTPKSISNDPQANTIIYPISQFTPLLPSNSDTSTELPLLTRLLTLLNSPSTPSSWTFTAGYFNPSPTLTSLLLHTTSKNNTVLTASPHANGFYNSPGVSGMLPSAYTLLLRKFLAAVQKAQSPSPSITLREWKRGTVNEPGGWTYHAKGLWVSFPSSSYSPGTPKPAITVLGSSNYTKRSYTLDLETGVMIVTKDPELQERLRQERDGLGEWASEVGMKEFQSSGRRVGLHVRIAMWIVGVVGGAL
ncbi:CDP-diacylglycerol--glycerol-3-phosphate 3-phosphatidyltransferase [Ciborinia camelliae]|nr:CDP-diacylglycerol--glycerol-3-phosphate 3-phosphatidyltransferase [Ciborinia camelliae]